MIKNNEFTSCTIKSFRMNDDVNKEKLKYHYTSPEAFLSIVESQKIRFADVRFMNDKTEHLYFIKVLLGFMDENGINFQKTREAINIILKENYFNDISSLNVRDVKFTDIKGFKYNPDRHFIFCSSEEADSLNMWNYYVSNGRYQGYNIGFNIKKLLKTFDVANSQTIDAFSVHYGKILYKEKEQFEELEKFLTHNEKIYKNHQREIEYIAIGLRRYIDAQGLFYKSSKFESEKEYRILISISEQRIPSTEEMAEKYFGLNNKKMVEGFYVKNGLIVPYLSVLIPSDAISRITTSPMTEHELAKASIKELTNLKQYNGIKVFQSNIPIRF